jgi:hypothetical protein
MSIQFTNEPIYFAVFEATVWFFVGRIIKNCGMISHTVVFSEQIAALNAQSNPDTEVMRQDSRDVSMRV